MMSDWMNRWPMQLIVVVFPDAGLPAGVIQQLRASKERGVIRLVDGGFVAKGAEGEVLLLEGAGFDFGDATFAGTLAGALFGCGADGEAIAQLEETALLAEAENAGFGLSADDLAEISDRIPRGSVAVILLIEHRWVAGFTESVEAAQGTLLAQGWITPKSILEITSSASEFLIERT
jgi:uncharacterized membrane protein